MTREEIIKHINNCIFNHDDKQSAQNIINDVFDYVEELEQRIKELEVLQSIHESEVNISYCKGLKDSHDGWVKTLKDNFGIEL